METSLYFNIGGSEIVHETIDGETVIVNLENGNYYSIQNSGVDIWNEISSSSTLNEIVSVLQDRYQVDHDVVNEAVNKLLVELQKEGLVQVSSEKRQGSFKPIIDIGNNLEKPEFIFPVLEKFTDMQELLLLDPIHEVDEEGWPHQAVDDGAGDA